MTVCPICLFKEQDKTNLENHLKLHGYNDLQVDILLDYEPKYKGLIDNVNYPDLSACYQDNRCEMINQSYKTVYRFLLPSELDHFRLKVKKNYEDLLYLYKDILSSHLYVLKTRIDKEPNKKISFFKFTFLALSELYDELIFMINEVNSESIDLTPSTKPQCKFQHGTVFFSWDNIEFQDSKVVVHIYETEKHYSFKNEFSQLMLNIIKDFFFKTRFPNKIFTIHFDTANKINQQNSTIYKLEALLRTERKNISDSLMKFDIRKKRSNLNDYNSKSDKVLLKRVDFKEEKNKFIRLAVGYCLDKDNIYSIKENNNGTTEHSLIIEFVRKNYIYVLVENENVNRSAHLFVFNKTSIDHIEKIYGFFFSDKENKRLLMRQAKEELKQELNTALKIRVLNHNNYQNYKEHLQHYLYMLG